MPLYQRSKQPFYTAQCRLPNLLGLPPKFYPLLTFGPRRKKAVNTQTSELEALEARLKATEERLKKAASGSPPPKSTGHTNSSTSPKHETRVKNTSRPQTKDGNKEAGHSAPPVPGALPPTPGASEGTCSDSEYVLVKRVDK